MENIHIDKAVSLLDTKYIRVFDLQYAQGKHYYDATRNDLGSLVAMMSDDDFVSQCPNAVTCAVICCPDKGEPMLLMAYEYRYPTGRFLLSPPAGLIDRTDGNNRDKAVISAAKREIYEETGIKCDEEDVIHIINPLLFSSPGMTDESNAMACIIKKHFDERMLSQAGAEGTECFDGFQLLTSKEALKVLTDGKDKNGNYYSVYTWIALMYFVSDMWKEYVK